MEEFIGQLDDELEDMQTAILHLHHQNTLITRERDQLQKKLVQYESNANGDMTNTSAVRHVTSGVTGSTSAIQANNEVNNGDVRST